MSVTHSTEGEPRGVKPAQLRIRHRAQMRQAFIDTARELVAAEGEGALTMKRLAAEFECSIGTLYRYFPSKEGLLATVRHERLVVLDDASTRRAARTDQLVARAGASRDLAALARVVSAGGLWSEAARAWPHEVSLARRLLVEPAPDEPMPPVTTSLVDRLTAALEHAVEVGALAAGHARARALLIITIVPALPLAVGLGRLDGDPGAEDELPQRLLDCLLAAWGADMVHLGQADTLLVGV